MRNSPFATMFSCVFMYPAFIQSEVLLSLGDQTFENSVGKGIAINLNFIFFPQCFRTVRNKFQLYLSHTSYVVCKMLYKE